MPSPTTRFSPHLAPPYPTFRPGPLPCHSDPDYPSQANSPQFPPDFPCPSPPHPDNPVQPGPAHVHSPRPPSDMPSRLRPRPDYPPLPMSSPSVPDMPAQSCPTHPLTARPTFCSPPTAPPTAARHLFDVPAQLSTSLSDYPFPPAPSLLRRFGPAQSLCEPLPTIRPTFRPCRTRPDYPCLPHPSLS